MIDVWIERLSERPEPEMLVALSDSERARFDRIRSPASRSRYAIAHHWLHTRLAHILGIAPAEVAVRVDSRGAPWLEGSRLQFSFSHHRGFVAVATSIDTTVGIDVLEVPDDTRFLADTALVLSPSEIALVRSSLPARRGAVFAHCWTRKEAYAKCLRTGLTGDLATLTLTPSPTGRSEAALWSRELHGAAVAVATTAPDIHDIRLHDGSQNDGQQEL